jgi:hypothetical protein
VDRWDPEPSAAEVVPEALIGPRRLAAAVLLKAVEDLRVQAQRESAARFLLSADAALWAEAAGIDPAALRQRAEELARPPARTRSAISTAPATAGATNVESHV